LTVAKYLIKDPKFINRAEIIKNRLIGENRNPTFNPTVDLPIRRSNFNKDLLMNYCQICMYRPQKEYHKELESHHIHFQHNCLEDGSIIGKPYLHKNILCNLVVLCRKCHEKVHRNEIIIHKYADTSVGPLLEYSADVNKMINSQIKKIKSLDKVGASEKHNLNESDQLN